MTGPDDTAAVTGAITAGDTAAFALFYRRWFDRTVSDVRRFTGRDESFALDVTQDVMITAMHKLPRLRAEAQLHAWLRRTALRRALTRLRAERRAGVHERRSAAREHDPARADAETSAWLNAALADEPAVIARLFEARVRFGWTLERAGSVVGLSPSAADGRINRAAERLRARANEEGVVND